MSGPVPTRWAFAICGAAAGLAVWLLAEAAENDLLGERLTLFLAVLISVFTGAFFAMAGTLRLRGAAFRAAPLSLMTAGLVWLVSMRWPGVEGLFGTPAPLLAGFAVAVLPVPFLLAEASRGNWRDYPALFGISWTIFVRAMVAAAFTGAVWLVILLSSALLEMVGITVIRDLLLRDGMPLVISGAAFGLAVAVVNELAEHLSPRLVHWLLRLLLPVVTVVSAVFTGAALIRGFDDGFPGLSPAAALLAMAAAGILLVTVALDADDAEATQSPVLLWSARAMSLLLPVLAGLAFWAVWIRIAAYGPTPTRLLVLVLVLIALVYGLVYAAAILRGRGWAGHIRAANPWLALGVICAAVLWMTPVVDAEAISARAQAGRVIAGDKSLEDMGYSGFRAWGFAGERAMARIGDHALAEGDEALLASVRALQAGDYGGFYGTVQTDSSSRRPALITELESLLPVQPDSASGTKTMLLGEMEEWDLDQILSACQNVLDGRPGCLMVVADLLPEVPGEEAVILLAHQAWTEGYGLMPGPSGGVMRLDLRGSDGSRLYTEQLTGLLTLWQVAPPPLAPARINQLGTGGEGIFFVP
ncbi:DUF4153 domain-containing protein [Pseudogemmobacter humi]|uniref:DUF4153 domain-containing protein n=1 Tax=Pseudogemmobacter humi TaxID=2483812 RepID=A0A3P5XLF3_9RHOB|nr:DUF4153 domain-containing protein [Pseudogemmobacter humi]VDC28556.1 hypothetical protein XINFAN_02138 [Pseudogemmobacter humi]